MKAMCAVVMFVLLMWNVNTHAQDADPASGERLYKVCAGCHGFEGQGNALVNAPGLAGQADWYLTRQLQNYRKGIRGDKRDDVHGQTMANMTATLTSDQQVADVVAYIGQLDPVNNSNTSTGDASRGKALYNTCAACHGQAGEGNAALQGPALVGLGNWYQVAQLKKFKNGQRGKHPQDTYGAQMAPMAAVLADDQAMADVSAYIATLGE